MGKSKRSDSPWACLRSNYESSGRLERYRSARLALIQALGGRCFCCGKVYKLEFHHRFKRTWVARKVARHNRIARYRREAMAGAVILLCKGCNAKRGKPKAHKAL